MMPQVSKRWAMASILALASVAAWGQTFLAGAEMSMKLPASFSAGAGVEVRSMEWVKHTRQWSAEASVGYKPAKWLKISAGYKFIQAQTPSGFNSDGYAMPSYWDHKHRASFSLTGQWKPFGKLTLSLRERYQFTYRGSHLVPQFNEGIAWGNKSVNAKRSHMLRSRVQAEYKPKKKGRWTPFVNFELYSQLRDENVTKGKSEGARLCDKWRLAAGTELKLNKHNSLEVFYRYASHSDPDETDSAHTIAVVYSFSL